MKQSSSSRRVNEQAREVISSILLFEISDPRLQLVTITGCEVSFDRSACNVFYSTAKENYDDAADAFQKAAGRIRRCMAQQLSWRVTPQLRFLLDVSVDQAERIGKALAFEAERAPVDVDGLEGTDSQED
ncbi:MAG: 30S ribosome-binding factor RbfA [Coriobacteriia bacterium]|nr:30S ribosome-binding factor RbfA [Coriobacteriia bacterium]